MTSKGRSSIHRGFFSALHCLRRGDMVTVLSQIHLFSLSYSTSCNKTACIFIQAIEWLYSLSIMYQPETKQAIWQWMNAIFLIQPCPWYTKVGDQILTGIKCGKTRLIPSYCWKSCTFQLVYRILITCFYFVQLSQCEGSAVSCTIRLLKPNYSTYDLCLKALGEYEQPNQQQSTSKGFTKHPYPCHCVILRIDNMNNVKVTMQAIWNSSDLKGVTKRRKRSSRWHAWRTTCNHHYHHVWSSCQCIKLSICKIQLRIIPTALEQEWYIEQLIPWQRLAPAL